VPVPIKGIVEKDVYDDFDNMKPGGIVKNWNIYTGVWNQVAVVEDGQNNVLRLEDKDPYDYAKAVRIFPESTNAEISFRLRRNRVKDGNLEIEVLNYKGQRPVRIKVDGNTGKVEMNQGENMILSGSYAENVWLDFKINVNTQANTYSLKINNRVVASKAAFAEILSNTDNLYNSKFKIPTVERFEFRTGKYRMKDFSRYGFSANDYLKHKPDLPKSDDALANAVFDIDDFKATALNK
jgi:hypothetical protein